MLDEPIKIFALGIYGISLLVLFILSALAIYLVLKHGEKPAYAGTIVLMFIISEVIVLGLGAITTGFFK